VNKFILILLLNLFILGCNEKITQNHDNCIDEDKIIFDGVCLTVWEPVCGCDNITYSNECFASINGVKTWEKGVCS